MSLEERRAARAARRAKQTDEAAGVSTINGEDEFERRRRERRDQRLRGGEEEETTSRRSRRRQQAEEEEESSYSAPAEPAYDHEADSRRRQEEEAASRAAEEEYERQQEQERQRRDEQERQRREAEERRREEAERQQRIADQDPQSFQNEVQLRNKHETRHKSDSNGDVLADDRWSKTSFSTGIEVRRISEDGKASKLKSFFETPVDTTPKMNGHTPQSPVKRLSSLRSPSIDIEEDNPLNQVQEQLVKFETSMHVHQTPRFQGEGVTGSSPNSPRLGQFSTSEQHINDSWRDGGSVLARWQHDQTDADMGKRTSQSSSTMSLNKVNDIGEQKRRKSDKISLLTAKFNSVDSPQGGITSPVSPRHGSSLLRKWSLSSDTSSDTTDSAVTRWRARNSTSNITDRWQHNGQSDSPNSSFSRSRPLSSLSPELNKENRSRLANVRRSNSLSLDRSYTGRLEEEERLRLEQEEKEREEEARRMAEEQKKKKKKGLGGLSPEKKKMLKEKADDEDDESIDYETEKRRVLRQRMEPLPDLSCMSRAALQALCKDFHKKLATLEEDVYDWEAKIRKQDFEINELTLKVNDTKGKFVKPVLRKVNKTESKLDKIQRKDAKKSDFRDNLKSSSKFAEHDEDRPEGEEEAENE